MGSQTLELKWANHKSNMTAELQELYLSDALLDVTIACGEFSLKAHKTVLSASSTLFRKVFIDNPCKHPILIMTDVDFENMKTIVEFIYQGEIHISREKLTQFLKTADRLKIKGLSSIEDMNLNQSEQSEIDADPHYSSGTWEHTRIQPQLQDTTQENVHNSPSKLTDSVQSETNQDIPIVKIEDDLPHTDSNDCMYWQSECFDQASSSSVLPDCSLPSPSVSHQLSTTVSQQLSSPSVSRQLPTPSVSHYPPAPSIPHQVQAPSVSHQVPPPSVSHQIPAPSVSHQLATPSVSHQLRVPLNSERFTYSESQSDTGTLTQEENTGRDTSVANAYPSQDQSPITILPSTKSSFEVVDSLSSQSSSQGGKTVKEERARRQRRTDEPEQLLLNLKQKIETRVPPPGENYQLPNRLGWEERLSNFRNYSLHYNSTKFISCRRSFEIGYLLNDLHENYRVRYWENIETSSWSEWFLTFTTEHNISMTLRNERRLRKFFKDISQFPNLLNTGLTCSELSNILPKFFNALILFPNFKSFFQQPNQIQ